MAMPEPHPYFTVTAKDPAKQHLAELLQKILDHWLESDEECDKLGIPRKGRTLDYINGRWCIRCHNSLPNDWGIKPCDVCGAETGMMPLDGLTYDVMTEEPRTWPTYGGITRGPVTKE